MASARQRAVFGISMVVLGAALAWIASAYVVDHGYGKIAAAVIGLVAWPVAPVAWHAFGERRRATRLAAAKVPAKSTLTGFDRYWMRFVAIALIVLGPMFYSSKLGVFGSVKRQALWFVPATPWTVAAQPMLQRVPADAELVMMMHRTSAGDERGGTALLAWGARQALIVVDADFAGAEPIAKRLDEINATRDKVSFLPFDKLVEVSTSGKSTVIASEGWRGKVDASGSGMRDELRTELARAPDDATFVAAFAPRTKITGFDRDPIDLVHGVVWATARDKTMLIDGRIETRDAATAAKLAVEFDTTVPWNTSDLPENCREPARNLADRIKLANAGAILTVHAEIPTDALVGLMFCALQK